MRKNVTLEECLGFRSFAVLPYEGREGFQEVQKLVLDAGFCCRFASRDSKGYIFAVDQFDEGDEYLESFAKSCAAYLEVKTIFKTDGKLKLWDSEERELSDFAGLKEAMQVFGKKRRNTWFTGEKSPIDVTGEKKTRMKECLWEYGLEGIKVYMAE